MHSFQYHLFQQCMYPKGSDSKLMLSKLKSQFEELRSKVVFLDGVKKYLEVTTELYNSTRMFLLHFLTTPVLWCDFLLFCRFWAWTSGVWRFRYCRPWLCVDLALWTSSPLRTRLSCASVPAKGRALCKPGRLWDSWLTSTPGIIDEDLN